MWLIQCLPYIAYVLFQRGALRHVGYTYIARSENYLTSLLQEIKCTSTHNSQLNDLHYVVFAYAVVVLVRSGVSVTAAVLAPAVAE